MQLILTLLGLLATLCHSIPNHLPAPTIPAIDDFDLFGWTPRPTEGPSMELMKKRGLFARQATLSSGQLVGYFAPDTLCGYISGSIGAPVSCSTASRCAAIAPVGNLAGAVGCCPFGVTGSCYFIETCYNSVDIYVSSKCDAGCQKNADAQLCTNSASPYCFAYTWPDIDATSWGCASQSSQSTLGTVSFLFLGETDKRSWSAAYYTPTGSGTTGTTTNPLVGAQSSRSTSTSTQTIPPATSSAASGGSKSNTGAIVGGVVGGLAVLGAFAFAIAFLIMRRRRSNPNQSAGSAFSPAPGYAQPEVKDGMNQPQHYSQSFSSPQSPYNQGMEGMYLREQHGPMEMDGSTTMQSTSPSGPMATGPQGQPIYEAPAYPMSPHPPVR